MSDKYANAREAIDDNIRYVQNFPETGVLFEDLTPVLADPDAFHVIVDELADACERLGADIIGGLDARGFLLGSAVAYKLGLGILAIRKRGKLPPPVISEEYELEYGSAALEIPAEGIPIKGRKVALVDDVLATGGTMYGATKLLKSAGAEIAGHAVVIEVEGLGGRERLAGPPLVVLGAGSDADEKTATDQNTEA